MILTADRIAVVGARTFGRGAAGRQSDALACAELPVRRAGVLEVWHAEICDALVDATGIDRTSAAIRAEIARAALADLVITACERDSEQQSHTECAPNRLTHSSPYS